MDTAHYEHIRTWNDPDGDGFRLELYDTYATSYGKARLAYQFFYHDELIFEGNEFGCSPMHAIDSDEAVGGVLGFLCLQPGDTDPESFDDYTPRQLEWCGLHGEQLSLHVETLEGVRS